MGRSDDDLYTRSEAAKILGFETVQGVRALERAGKLSGITDLSGYVRFEPADIERLRAGREREGKPVMSAVAVATMVRTRVRPRRYEGPRRVAEVDSMQQRAEYRRWIEQRVAARNEDRLRDFLAAHVDRDAVGAALGVPAKDLFRRIGGLVGAGLLTEVKAPRELMVRDGYGSEAPAIEESAFSLIRGGPFYRVSDVLRLRAERLRENQKETAGRPEAAGLDLGHEPSPDHAPEDPIVAFVRALRLAMHSR